MKINLNPIYAGLEAWRDERKITAESQKEGYLINIMEEFGELAEALRNYEKIKNGEQVIKKYIASEWNENNAKYALLKHRKITLADTEYAIIDALCGISIFMVNTEFTINSGLTNKISSFDTNKYEPSDFADLHALLHYVSQYPIKWEYIYFKEILELIAKILEVDYGFNFEIAMLETIKEISSRTSSYDESAKKWVKDESEQAKSKWYKANYELARIEK